MTETSNNTQETPKKRQKKTAPNLAKAAPAECRELAETLGMTEASVRHHIHRLQAEQRLRHVGPTKGGYWDIID